MINLFIYYLKKFLPRKDRISSNFQYRHYLFNELIENIDTSNFENFRILEIGPRDGEDSQRLASLNPKDFFIIDLPNRTKNNLDWIVISSGGKLIDIAQDEGKEYIKIPSGLQPRAAFGYLTLAISRILDIVEGSDYVSQLNEASSYLEKLTEKAEDSDINKLSLDICESINKKTVIIYSGTNMSKVVSSRWKTQINENAKSKAFVGYLPEVHHNEILSWDADIDGSKNNYIVILIRDKNEHVQISKRFEFTKELIGEKVNIVEVNLNNQESTLKTLLELVLLGDLVSLNLANRLNIDPKNIDTIENLKKLLGG